MTVQPTFFRLLLLCLLGICCSFSAVPVEQTAPPLENKRQLRQQKRQHKKLLRLQRRQQARNMLRPNKNHKTLNTIGFILAVAAPLVFLIAFLISLTNPVGAGLILVLGIVLAAPINIASIILCIMGIVGSKGIEGSRRGLGIAGLIISCLPVLALLVILLLSSFG